jgi:hypothetical protein
MRRPQLDLILKALNSFLIWVLATEAFVQAGEMVNFTSFGRQCNPYVYQCFGNGSFREMLLLSHVTPQYTDFSSYYPNPTIAFVKPAGIVRCVRRHCTSMG